MAKDWVHSSSSSLGDFWPKVVGLVWAWRGRIAAVQKRTNPVWEWRALRGRIKFQNGPGFILADEFALLEANSTK